MGCGGSRLDGNGTALPPRLRPLLLLRPEGIKTRRHTRPVKESGSITSKRLLHEREEDENSSISHKNAANSMPFSTNHVVIFGRKHEEIQQGIECGKPNHEEREERKKHEVVKDGINVKGGKINEESEFEDALTDAYNDDDDDDDDMEDGCGRMFGHHDDGAFQGSPSFRVYFKDDGDKHNDLGKIRNDAFKSSIPDDDHTVSSKESCHDQNKKVKRGRKKKSLRKVLPKGGQAAVKNLLCVKLCNTPAPSPHHHHDRRTHFLAGKTTA